MATYRDGQVNILGLTNPGVSVAIIAPTPFVVGVPTNVEAFVGVGSWGPVNTVTSFDGNSPPYGVAQVRKGDIATHVAAAVTQGTQTSFRGVRVTDGTDTAATAADPSGGGTWTARYTGTLGNNINVMFLPSAAIGAFAAVISFPGRLPERFDGIYQGLAALTVTPGTGYTSVPGLSVSAPQKSGGVRATATASLTLVGTPVLGSGGIGHAVNDVVTLGAGIKIKVLSVTSGAIATFSVVSTGSITQGAVPANVGAQTASTGAGTGATFTGLTFGLGPATFTRGAGYYNASGAAITVTISGGGGTGGSYTPVASFWANLAHVVNNGNTQRGKSDVVVFSQTVSTAAPVLNVATTLSGGTDGDAGVTTSILLGQDIRPRTGMYALRGSGMDGFTLCDCVDPSIWSPMLALGISEAALPVVVMPSGTQIEDAVAARIAQGIDDSWIWILTGDWPSFTDTVNGPRLVSPAAFALGLLGNLSPELSPINKALIGVTATQTSQTGYLTADADESIAQTGGVDVIGRSAALGAIYFSFLTGRNASSNTAAQGIEYTRLTNFLSRSLQGAATRVIVGSLQSTMRTDDPTRKKAKSILDGFLGTLQQSTAGSNGYGMIDDFAVICDTSINTPTTIAMGYLFAYCAVRYLNTVRYFVIRLAGGGNVSTASVTTQSTQPTLADIMTLAQAAAAGN